MECSSCGNNTFAVELQNADNTTQTIKTVVLICDECRAEHIMQGTMSSPQLAEK
jgi:hypothetical protein